MLCSSLLQNIRMRNFDKFSDNKNAILFCTDVGARGFKSLVIHYHKPKRRDIFVHWSGRTTRANKNGKVFSLINKKEMWLYKRIKIDLNYKKFAMDTLPEKRMNLI